jgi:hypothetical protein
MNVDEIVIYMFSENFPQIKLYKRKKRRENAIRKINVPV